MLNPDLNPESLAAEFAADDRIRISNILDEEVANRIQEILLNRTKFDTAYTLGGKAFIHSNDELKRMSAAERQEMDRQILQAAANGTGFVYGSYMMRRMREFSDADESFMREVFRYLNSEELLQFIRTVTGDAELIAADGQFTRYVPGQFLTRHRDQVEEQGRRFAFVFGFTRRWHPDWGGLLQYFTDKGETRDAWAPAFNTLAMFDVRHIHSVTYVTPFAAEPRISLTGWFRNKPLGEEYQRVLRDE